MIWLTWRQFRAHSIVAFAALAATAIVLGITGPHLAHLFHIEIASCIGQSSGCDNATLSAFTNTYSFVQHFFGFVLIIVPGLVGAFWGAPLLTREIESGTHQIVWNQGVTRTRWLAVKVGLIGLASAAGAGLLSLMLTWWSRPLDRVNANRITPPVFDERGIDPIGWALFAFALGLTAAVLIRRTLPAMAATLAVFTGRADRLAALRPGPPHPARTPDRSRRLPPLRLGRRQQRTEQPVPCARHQARSLDSVRPHRQRRRSPSARRHAHPTLPSNDNQRHNEKSTRQLLRPAPRPTRLQPHRPHLPTRQQILATASSRNQHPRRSRRPTDRLLLLVGPPRQRVISRIPSLRDSRAIPVDIEQVFRGDPLRI
jgi:hypothetical protein